MQHNVNIEDFFNKYFIEPIVKYEGYNIVNTTVYAIIAIAMIFLIYKYFKKQNWNFDKHFLKSLLPFVMFGSVKRVITDVTDAGLANNWPYINYYQYNIFNVTPGIYLFVAFLFFICYIIEKKTKINNLCFYFGVILLLFHVFLLIPFIQYYDRIVIVLYISQVGYLIGSLIFKDSAQRAAVFSQGFDGAATFIGVEFYGYSEQHVLPSLIGGHFGYIAFFLLKIFISCIVIWLLNKEKIEEDEKHLVVYAIIVMGLAPGIRDTLRMAAGV